MKDNISNYKQWIKYVSNRYKQSQIKAAIQVNTEMLKFYFELGKDIKEKSFKAVYGNKFYYTLSKDLINELPNTKGLSPQNLRYMEKFYCLYATQIEKFPQLVGDLFSIPWGHHRCIIDRCKNVDKAIFFINKTLEYNWSRNVLLNFLDTNLYEREGKAITNFEASLPDLEKDLARQILRDPYNFDFLTIRKDYDERELKNALIRDIQKFLLELGSGFSFIAKEYRLTINEDELYIDLLFYNTKIHSYVVIEIKTTAFKPEYIGQLAAYVSAINHVLKSEKDGPTIGLLICKDKNDILAQYTLEGINFPLGISNFELNTHILKEYKNILPSIQEIEQELQDKVNT